MVETAAAQKGGGLGGGFFVGNHRGMRNRQHNVVGHARAMGFGAQHGAVVFAIQPDQMADAQRPVAGNAAQLDRLIEWEKPGTCKPAVR